jgi:hypothetical protein
MALYAVNNQMGGTPQNLTTSFKTILSARAITATLRRAFLYELNVGADGLPNATDCAIVWDLSAQTADGTATTVTAVALDQADVAGGTNTEANYTAEGTITANSARWTLAANQRASYRWVVNPCGPGEIVIPATNDVGFALRAKSSTYASTVVAAIMFRE